MSTYAHLGFDPVASDEASGRRIAGDLRRLVQQLGEADAVLSGTGDQQWQGQTAEAFRASVDEELRPRVTEAYQAFSTASRAIDGWVEALPAYRRRADALEEEARDAAARVSAATSALQGLEAPGPGAEQADRDDHDRQRRELSGSLGLREQELSGILQRARTLRGEVEQHSEEVAGALGTAMSAAPDAPGFLDRLGDVLSGLGRLAGELFDWFMENLAPLIQQLARVIGAIATILSVVAFVVGLVFPPAMALAGTLGAVARVAALVDIGIQALRVLHGEEGALEGLVLQGAGMLAGLGVARALGPIAINAQTTIANGPLVPAIAGISRGSGGAAATATLAMHVNPDFYLSLTYWTVTNYRSIGGALQTLADETAR